jgi:hypothetical protein
MSSAVSVPFDPPQPPGLVFFPVEKLAQVHIFDSPDLYASLCGEAAPMYDPSKPDKRWFVDKDTLAKLGYDLADPTAQYFFYTWKPKADGTLKREQVAIPLSAVPVVNIPVMTKTTLVSAPATIPPCPIPERALLANEQPVQYLLSVWMIRNNDLWKAQQQAAGTASSVGAGLSAEEHTWLKALYEKAFPGT